MLNPTAENGLAIIIDETACVAAVFGMRLACAPYEILFSAEARASGSPVSALPSSSASNSRVREIAIWISEAAMGARMALSSTPIRPNAPEPPLSRSSSYRCAPPKYISEYPR